MEKGIRKIIKMKDGTPVHQVRFHDQRTGRRKKLSSGETTFGKARTFAEDFFHDKKRPFSEYHAKARRGHLVNHILPMFGNKRLGDLTQPMIERWLGALRLSTQTKNHVLHSFKIVTRGAEKYAALFMVLATTGIRSGEV
jgi:hypothetical protein